MKVTNPYEHLCNIIINEFDIMGKKEWIELKLLDFVSTCVPCTWQGALHDYLIQEPRLADSRHPHIHDHRFPPLTELVIVV